MQKPGNLQGVGHSAMFKDKKGRLRIVYHAHKDKEHIHPRGMYIGKVYFEKVDGIDACGSTRNILLRNWSNKPGDRNRYRRKTDG